MRNRHLMLVALVVFLAPALLAQADRADIFIKDEMQRQNIPGLSLVVLKEGQIVKSAGYGVANINLKMPATPETIYKIASLSKQLIATGIMLLVQENKVGLNDPIRNYLQRSPDAWKPITIRHLLTPHVGPHPRRAWLRCVQNPARCRGDQERLLSPAAFRAGRQVGVFQSRLLHSGRGHPQGVQSALG